MRRHTFLKTKLSGLLFYIGSFKDVTGQIAVNILAKKSQIILPCSLNDLANIAQNEVTARSYRAVDVCTTDGMPLVWLMKWKIRQDIERVYGPDLMTALCQNSDIQKLRHVFYGSSENTLQQLTAKMKKIAPKLHLSKTISPPMHDLTAAEESAYLVQLQKLKPDVLWIGLSSPKQIELAARWKKHFPTTTFICVGAAFDFVAENKVSAPNWMKKSGLEWLFRLINEPKRLWKRYLVVIPHFLLFHGLELLVNP